MNKYIFEWDLAKEISNINKHGFNFTQGIEVFADPNVIHLEDVTHSKKEARFYALGKINSGLILTVRYTVRENKIRIFGVAKWRKWITYYEENTRSK